MKKNRWGNLMRRLGLPPDTATYYALYGAYSEKHRHYHTVSHVADCLAKLDVAKETASAPDEVECAIWFHDAVYNPLSPDNEQKSADWARDFLTQQGAGYNFTARVCTLIMATRHDSTDLDGDAGLLIDIDLSILGAETDAYQSYENTIRKEYHLVPLSIYAERRVAVLSSFLARDRIYTHDSFYNQYEIRARRNISHAISKHQHVASGQ